MVDPCREVVHPVANQVKAQQGVDQEPEKIDAQRQEIQRQTSACL